MTVLVSKKNEEQFHASLPLALYAAAGALIDYLTLAPFAEPKRCPWCGHPHFNTYHKEPRHRCKGCKRSFTPVTLTPFANCRHQDKWAVYAKYRLEGKTIALASEQSQLSHGAGEHREKVIVQILRERWPTLLPWWQGLRQLTSDGKPAALRTNPFASLEEAKAHHDHEYIQCLECGEIYSQLSGHLKTIHEMTAEDYRQKWQIMKQIPLAGFACRRKHSDYMRGQIASGDVDPHALVALMHEANKLTPRKKPFKTQYELDASRKSMLERQPWHISPAIKIADEKVKRCAVERANNRAPGETLAMVAAEFGIWPGTLWSWRKQQAGKVADEAMVNTVKVRTKTKKARSK